MTSTVLDTAALDHLREGFTGEVVTAADASYDEARAVFNAMIDKRPAVVAQCETTADVARAVRFGRDHDLEVAVRGGGHSVAGMGVTDGGIVVDLRRMCAVGVDPDARTARVGGGATMSHLDRATEAHGLVTTGGRVSTTGVGGFVLGGGSGWLERKFGLASDNLLAVDLVTAEGEQVHADDDENPELFWALHGGGGNFGVATSFTLRLHELPVLTAALMLWPAASGPDVLRAYRDLMEGASDDLGGGVLYATAPAEPFVPEALVGEAACVVLLIYTGPEAAARRAFEPILGLGPAGRMVAELPYAELQCMLDDPPGMRNYWSAEYLESLPDEAIDLFDGLAGEMIVPSASQQVLLPLGGTVARGSTDHPLPWRSAPWVAHPFGLWDDPADDERGRRWARDVRAALAPWSTGAVYLNFIGHEGHDRVVAGFGAEKYRRLVDVKTAFDPENVFHLNHNIEPR